MKIGLSHPPVKVVWRIVSEDSVIRDTQFTFDRGKTTNDSLLVTRPFLLIVRTVQIITATTRNIVASTDGYSEFPAYGQICLRNYGGPVHSYGRRLPGLRSRASLQAANPIN